jgi:hypothetical protein
MICEFSFKGAPVYIRAASIIAIMQDSTSVGRTVIFTEPPLDSIIVDESVDVAFEEWYINLNEADEEVAPWNGLSRSEDDE